MTLGKHRTRYVLELFAVFWFIPWLLISRPVRWFTPRERINAKTYQMFAVLPILLMNGEIVLWEVVKCQKFFTGSDEYDGGEKWGYWRGKLPDKEEKEETEDSAVIGTGIFFWLFALIFWAHTQ